MRAGRPLRFCLVTTFYPPYHFGGDGVFVHRLAEALAERGHHVEIIHSLDAYHLQHPGPPEVPFAHHPGVRRIGLQSSWPLGSSLLSHQLGHPGFYSARLRQLLDNGRYDVIHHHNISLMGGPGVLRLGRAIKLYTTHEYWLICPTHVLFKFNRQPCESRSCLSCTLHAGRPPQLWRHTGLLRRSLAHVDCLLTPSQFALNRHHADGIDRPMIHLPHFVAPPDLPSPPLRGRGIGSEGEKQARPYFLFAGRLERLKGAHDLIRLFSDYRHADLLIAGAGTEAEALRRQACDLTHVKFLGPVHPAALSDLYRAALAVLVPSLCYETFGLSAVEALAHGTPVVVRRLGALPEIVEQSGAGYTFETLDECRAIMERLRSQPLLRAELGRRGQEAVRRLWSCEAHLGHYFALIEELSNRRSSLAA